MSSAVLALSVPAPSVAVPVPAVPRLIELSRSPDALVRQQAALALGKIGPAAKEGVSALAVALDDGEWPVRRQAAIALGEIGPDAKLAKPVLQKRTKDDNALVRKAAEEALKRLD